jgi:hypothetical protein
MDEKPRPDLGLQMNEARELLEEGEVRGALVLAMDVLWQELDQLRGTLGAIHENMPPGQEEFPGEFQMSPPVPEFIWSEPLSRLLH